MQQDTESEFIPTETSPASMDELMNEFELSDADLEQRAQEYETETWSLGHERIYAGSHYDAVGRKRVTVIYPAEDVQKVSSIANAQGVKASDIYRKALSDYLHRIDHDYKVAVTG